MMIPCMPLEEDKKDFQSNYSGDNSIRYTARKLKGDQCTQRVVTKHMFLSNFFCASVHVYVVVLDCVPYVRDNKTVKYYTRSSVSM